MNAANYQERKLEIDKKLLINRLKVEMAAFDKEVEAMVMDRMKTMDVVKILEMKQYCLYEDII